MKRAFLEKILIDYGYKRSSIDSILSGRRRPNPDNRYEFEKKFNIPFNVWGKSIKPYLQENDTKTKQSEQENRGAKI